MKLLGYSRATLADVLIFLALAAAMGILGFLAYAFRGVP